VTTIWDVPAQGHAVDVLRDAVAADAVGHAWALTGPRGVGQEALTRSLVAALNCDVERSGCGTCPSCLRSLRGAHPAYWEFAPVGSVHRVGDVRDQWTRVASRTAAEGHVKVLRVIDADRMNEAAANAFLKMLEEPPPRTVWVLELADPDELPDTIVSRCRVVRVSPWDRDTLRAAADRVPGATPADRELAVRAAMGAPTRLRHLLDADGALEDVRRHRRIPRELRAQGPGYALVAAQELGAEMKRAVAEVQAQARQERVQLEEFYGDAPPRDVVRQLEQRATRREREVKTTVAQTTLDDLAGWYRDVLLIRAGGEPAEALHADDVEGLRADADALSDAALLRSLDTVFARREELELNVQVTLAVEALLLDLWTIAAT
jgi:DNA polymerase-3 subunit delta'